MRVVFLGNARWSVPSLASVADSAHDVVLVLTRTPRVGGRGNRPIRTAVANAAQDAGLPLREVETVKSGEGFEAIAGAEPDVLAVVAYGEILPPAVLETPRVAPVNVHFSLLPALRGAAPVQHALLSGLDRTGVTTIRMDQGMDTGPILLQAEESVRPDDDAGSLGDRLAILGGHLLVRTLDGLADGSIPERAQEHDAATFAPKFKPGDRVIDWAQPAEGIIRQVRAMAPEPGATTSFRGRALRVLRAVQADAGPGSRPGTVVGNSPEGPIVAARGGGVALTEVQLEGRRRMTGAEFARGHRPVQGEVLGPVGSG